jgi:hypothetical protein
MEHQSSRLAGGSLLPSPGCAAHCGVQVPSEGPRRTPINGLLLCFQKFDAGRGEGHDGFEEDGGAGVVFGEV